jgi:putative transposase
MSDRFQHKYRIPSTRLQNWDYSWKGAYFITICTANRVCCFGEIVDHKMILNKLGIIADIMWNEIKYHAKGIDLGEHVVMPNHVHGILILTENNGNHESILPDDLTAIEPMATDLTGIEPMATDLTVETRHALSLQSTHPQSTHNQSNHPQSNIQPSNDPAIKTIGQQRFQNQGKRTVSSIVGGYKSSVTRYAHRYGFDFEWQTRFYDIIIQNKTSFERVSDYICTNPQNWKEDRFFEI